MRARIVSMGYDAVKMVARDKPARWLGVIRDVHDTIANQIATDGVDHTYGPWVKKRTGRKPPSLAPLERWGVLEKKRWGVVEGLDLDATGKTYYRMPDMPGVARALEELGV